MRKLLQVVCRAGRLDKATCSSRAFWASELPSGPRSLRMNNQHCRSSTELQRAPGSGPREACCPGQRQQHLHKPGGRCGSRAPRRQFEAHTTQAQAHRPAVNRRGAECCKVKSWRPGILPTSHTAVGTGGYSDIGLRRGESMISSTHLEPLIRFRGPGQLLLHCRSSIGNCCPGWCSAASCRLVRAGVLG